MVIFLEIGLDSNPSFFLPPELNPLWIFLNGNDTENIEHVSVRGNCYASCFEKDLPEITLHSIMGFGSRYVEKMKILKMTNDEMEKPCDNCPRNKFKSVNYPHRITLRSTETRAPSGEIVFPYNSRL